MRGKWNSYNKSKLREINYPNAWRVNKKKVVSFSFFSAAVWRRTDCWPKRASWSHGFWSPVNCSSHFTYCYLILNTNTFACVFWYGLYICMEICTNTRGNSRYTTPVTEKLIWCCPTILCITYLTPTIVHTKTNQPGNTGASWLGYQKINTSHNHTFFGCVPTCSGKTSH